MNFKEQQKTNISLVESIISEYLPKEEGKQKTVIEAMNYSILAGGKRLRPMLVMETAKKFDFDLEAVKPFMAAIEMIHTYSLVHDDLPAMDNDEYRRGRKTTHIQYGEDIAILAGDGLLNFAYETGLNAIVNAKDTVSAAKALKILADKAGIYGMVGGQTADVEATNKVPDMELINFIYELKTGALIEASMTMGAVLSGATHEEVDCIEKAASLIGMAFQIQDDILDLTGDELVLGKPVLSDERNNKTTFVTINGIEESAKIVKKYTEEAIELIDKVGKKNEYLDELLINLVYRNK